MNKLQSFYEKKEKTIITLFFIGVFIGSAIMIYLLATGKVN